MNSYHQMIHPEVFDRTLAHFFCHSVLLGRLVQVVADALTSVGLPFPPSRNALSFRQVTGKYPVFSVERATKARVSRSRGATEDDVLFFEPYIIRPPTSCSLLRFGSRLAQFLMKLFMHLWKLRVSAFEKLVNCLAVRSPHPHPPDGEEGVHAPDGQDGVNGT